jgi:hypothetical protein
MRHRGKMEKIGAAYGKVRFSRVLDEALEELLDERDRLRSKIAKLQK